MFETFIFYFKHACNIKISSTVATQLLEKDICFKMCEVAVAHSRLLQDMPQWHIDYSELRVM